jgi:hypothetical protein
MSVSNVPAGVGNCYELINNDELSGLGGLKGGVVVVEEDVDVERRTKMSGVDESSAAGARAEGWESRQ